MFLYNGLFAISSYYKDLKYLESPIFEVMDEIDSCIITGFTKQALRNYLKSGIDPKVVEEIGKFGEFVNKIENKYWNPDDFDNYDDWKLAREWASNLLNLLGWKKKSWDDSETTVIYTDD